MAEGNNVVAFEGDPLDNPAFKRYLEQQQSSSNAMPKPEIAFVKEFVAKTDIVELMSEWAFAVVNPQLIHENLRLEPTEGQSTGANFVKLKLCKKNIHGQLPASISNLKCLCYINLGFNNLKGPIPTTICELTALEELWMDHNQFTGTIPAALGNLKRLQQVSFSANKLQGEVPASTFELQELRRLNVSMNYLSGMVEMEVRFENEMPRCLFIY